MQCQADDDARGQDDGCQHDSDGHVAFSQLFDFVESGSEGVEDFNDDAQRYTHSQCGDQSPGEGTSEFKKDLIHASAVHSWGGTALLAGNF